MTGFENIYKKRLKTGTLLHDLKRDNIPRLLILFLFGKKSTWVPYENDYLNICAKLFNEFQNFNS